MPCTYETREQGLRRISKELERELSHVTRLLCRAGHKIEERGIHLPEIAAWYAEHKRQDAERAGAAALAETRRKDALTRNIELAAARTRLRGQLTPFEVEALTGVRAVEGAGGGS